MGGHRLKQPEDLVNHTLLHDSSRRDWQSYVRQLELDNIINVKQGPIFSHSAMLIQAAVHGQGVALANNVIAKNEIDTVGLCVLSAKYLLVKMRFTLFVRKTKQI